IARDESADNLKHRIVACVAELPKHALSVRSERPLVPSPAGIRMDRVELVAEVLHAGRRDPERLAGRHKRRSPTTEPEAFKELPIEATHRVRDNERFNLDQV